MRDKYGREFIWRIKFMRYVPFVDQFYQREDWLDGGSVTRKFGWLQICKWIIHEPHKWQVRWDPCFKPFFSKEIFVSRSTGWHIGFFTVYHWIGRDVKYATQKDLPEQPGLYLRTYDKRTGERVSSAPMRELTAEEGERLQNIFNVKEGDDARQLPFTEEAQGAVPLFESPDFERYRYVIEIVGW